MRPKATIEIEKLGTEYLILVRSLSEELACAIAAISRNDLEALKKHVESQEALCAQLLAISKSRPLQANSAALSTAQNVFHALIQTNRAYAALLETSGRSHQVLLMLCKTYKDSSCHASERAQRACSLSCEV